MIGENIFGIVFSCQFFSVFYEYSKKILFFIFNHPRVREMKVPHRLDPQPCTYAVYAWICSKSKAVAHPPDYQRACTIDAGATTKDSLVFVALFIPSRAISPSGTKWKFVYTLLWDSFSRGPITVLWRRPCYTRSDILARELSRRSCSFCKVPHFHPRSDLPSE